jgi:hypothetical protein
MMLDYHDGRAREYCMEIMSRLPYAHSVKVHHGDLSFVTAIDNNRPQGVDLVFTFREAERLFRYRAFPVSERGYQLVLNFEDGEHT